MKEVKYWVSRNSLGATSQNEEICFFHSKYGLVSVFRTSVDLKKKKENINNIIEKMVKKRGKMSEES